jgi:hypothetical protein
MKTWEPSEKKFFLANGSQTLPTTKSNNDLDIRLLAICNFHRRLLYFFSDFYGMFSFVSSIQKVLFHSPEIQ